MIWLFERAGQLTRIDTHFDNDTQEYVVTVTWTDARSEERFTDAPVYHARLLALEHQLVGEHWKLISSPTLNPEGFPHKKPGDTEESLE